MKTESIINNMLKLDKILYFSLKLKKIKEK